MYVERNILACKLNQCSNVNPALSAARIFKIDLTTNYIKIYCLLYNSAFIAN